MFSDSIEKDQKQREAEAAVGENALTEAAADEPTSVDDAVADEPHQHPAVARQGVVGMEQIVEARTVVR